jgi:hypothetical protein
MTVTRARSRFVPSEDSQLIQLVEQCGTTSWEKIASEMPGRTSRQCRDRWNHYLSNKNVLEPWTPEEDARLLDKIGTVGLRWARLVKFFPDRTMMYVKRRWLYLFTYRRSVLRGSAIRSEVVGQSVKGFQREVERGADSERERPEVALWTRTFEYDISE